MDGGTIALIVLLVFIFIGLVIGLGCNSGFSNVNNNIPEPNYDGPCLYGSGVWGLDKDTRKENLLTMSGMGGLAYED